MLIPGVTVGVIKPITLIGSGKLLCGFGAFACKHADFVFIGTLALRNIQKCSNMCICMNLTRLAYQQRDWLAEDQSMNTGRKAYSY